MKYSHCNSKFSVYKKGGIILLAKRKKLHFYSKRKKSINQSTPQSNDKSINQSTAKWLDESINESIEPPKRDKILKTTHDKQFSQVSYIRNHPPSFCTELAVTDTRWISKNLTAHKLCHEKRPDKCIYPQKTANSQHRWKKPLIKVTSGVHQTAIFVRAKKFHTGNHSKSLRTFRRFDTVHRGTCHHWPLLPADRWRLRRDTLAEVVPAGQSRSPRKTAPICRSSESPGSHPWKIRPKVTRFSSVSLKVSKKAIFRNNWAEKSLKASKNPRICFSPQMEWIQMRITKTWRKKIHKLRITRQ